jgi:hypothetical protein
VKYYVFAMSASLALAQSVTNSYTTDVNGNRVAGSSVVATDGGRTEVFQNLNGQRIPLQQTDERVLRRDGNLTVSERIVRKYDRNGALTGTERQLVEEQKRPGGSTTHVTTYRSDVNGKMTEAEHQTTEIDKQGSVTRTQTVTERPSLNGSFNPVEKRSSVLEESGRGSHEDETIYQRSDNGGYVIRAREVKDTSRAGNKTTEKSTLYQPIATSSQLQLTQQSVSTTTSRPDGSELVETSLYGSSWSGHVGDNQSAPQLREQDVVERKPGPGGSVTESLSVRRASASDAGKLGPLTKVSETVCTGKCTGNK